MARPGVRVAPGAPFQVCVSFCVSLCESTVDSRGRPCATLYRAQMTYEINPLSVECFGGVAGDCGNFALDQKFSLT